jgi:hypothetical protein
VKVRLSIGSSSGYDEPDGLAPRPHPASILRTDLAGDEPRLPSLSEIVRQSVHVWLVDSARNLWRRLTFDPALSPNGNVVVGTDSGGVRVPASRQSRHLCRNVNGVGTETALATRSTSGPKTGRRTDAIWPTAKYD